MKRHPGYYSLIQYCPDPSRLEVANIGVLLFCDKLNFLDVKISENNRRILKFFRENGLDLDQIKAARSAIKARVSREKARFNSILDLQRFVETRANEILLTDPRPIKVHDPEKQLENLFEELVEKIPKRQKPKEPLIPKLDRAFKKPSLISKISFDQKFPIQILRHDFEVPYAYRNGTTKLIKPERFRDISRAETLAIQWDLLKRDEKSDSDRMELTVIPIIERRNESEIFQKQVSELLEFYEIKTHSPDQLDELIDKVMQEAH